MKIKTAELIRPALDWAVSTALQHKPEKDFHSHGMTWNGWWETAAYIDTKPNEYRRVPRYSIDWSQGGPIIEREGITIRRRGPGSTQYRQPFGWANYLIHQALLHAMRYKKMCINPAPPRSSLPCAATSLANLVTRLRYLMNSCRTC